MKSLLIVFMLIALASAQLPSDLIQTKEAPKVIDLRNTAPESAKAIDSINLDLSQFEFWAMPNYGHYNSQREIITQDINTSNLPKNIVEFINGEEVLPASIGPGIGAKKIGGNLSGLVFL